MGSAESRTGKLVWFVAYTNPRCEERAKMGLRAKGLRAFVPELTKWSRVGRRRHRVNHALFVRYVFVGLPAEMLAFGDVRATDGIHSLVGIEGKPVSIPDDFVADLALAVVTGVFDMTVEDSRKPRYMPGEKVRFTKGPFAGKIGEIATAESDKRVEILLSLMGRESKVSAETSQLEAA